MRALLVPLALAVLALGACSGPPRASGDPQPAEPAQAIATSDGVGVTLSVDRTLVAAGGDLVAAVTVRNAAPGIVTWQGGGCELEGQFAVTPLLTIGAAPIGHVWDGDKNVIKQLALPEAYTIREPVPPDQAHVDVAFACPADLAYKQLKPGEQAGATVVWVATTAAGSPAPAGDYEVAVAFPFMGRDIADPLASFEAAAPVKPITARIVVTVEDHAAGPSASDAMDAVLGDAAFTAWLTEHRRESWNSVAIRYIDGAWVVQVRYAPDRMLSARRDPGTGGVSLSEGPAPTFRVAPPPQL